MNDLSPQDIITWLRDRAKSFSDMADNIEGVFTAPTSARIPSQSAAEPTPENIRKLVKRRGHRVADLARKFGVEPEEIRRTIHADDSGLKIIPRGWVKAVNNYEVKPTARGDMSPVVT